MAIRIEIDPELAARSVESLSEMLAEEVAKIETVEKELKTIGGDISAGLNDTDLENSFDLIRRRRELPLRLLALKVRRDKIESALCDVRMREAEPALADAFAELTKLEKALQKAQENRDRALLAWQDLDNDQRDLKDRLTALAVRMRDLKDEQLRLIPKAAA